MAAGGIAVRSGARPLIAIVQRRKDNGWMLPKGKLKPGEKACAAARREVTEETGHEVVVHEFLGAVTYGKSRKSKVAQFWRMDAAGAASSELMRDIKAVRWLPLKAAIDKLDDPVEQVFLRHVGQRVIKLTHAAVAPASFDAPAPPDDASVAEQPMAAPATPAPREPDIRPTLLQRVLQMFRRSNASVSQNSVDT